MQSARLLPFDPIVLVQDVLKRWLVVVLAALAVGIGTYIYTDATYAPVYQTTTTFVVTTRGSSTSVYSNLSSTSNLAGLFTELLNSSIMRKTILQETDISSFDGTIDTAVVPNTNLITMTVTDSDPRMAFLAAQAIIEHHESLTYQVIDDIGLEVLQYPGSAHISHEPELCLPPDEKSRCHRGAGRHGPACHFVLSAGRGAERYGSPGEAGLQLSG